MTELLTLGGCRFILSKIISKICTSYCKNVLYKNDPELVYYESGKNNSLLNKIVQNILLYLLYCVPGFSDILFVLHSSGNIINCGVVKTNVDELSVKIRTKGTSPINKKARMDNIRSFYDSKSITDSLILDGASDNQIKEVLKCTKKELGESFENEDEYRRVSNNASNMSRLKKYASCVENPAKLYKDTKDNEITDIFISDEDLERLVVHMNLMYSSGEFERSKTYRIKK